MKSKRVALFRVLLFSSLLSFSLFAQIRSDFDRKMNQPIKPFNIIGNIYYVGASDVASYLIATSEGHILIDGGFEETVPQIEKNIATLGFKLTDVKILLNNHAHYDHAGGLATLKERTGAKLYAAPEQALQLERGGKNDFAFADKISFKPVTVNAFLKDGQDLTLGATILKTHYTPGHTKGCTTWTTQIAERGQIFHIIFQCSISALNYKLIDNLRYPDIAQDFEMTFAKLKTIKVDVFLGSHAQFFKMDKKLQLWELDKTSNPFIDPNGYKDFVKRNEQAFQAKLKKQTEAAN